MRSFDEVFQVATGREPYGFEQRIVRDGLPDVVRAPSGAGKAAVVLAWLWRRLHGPDPAGTPRRLVFALPQCALVEQTAGEVRGWLTNLQLDEEVALHVVAASRAENLGDWRENMHRPAIVVGTTDYLVSRVLNRGFGLGRALFPIDYALLANGAHWVIDDPLLCRQSTATLRRLAGFASRYGTAEPFGLTCLSVARTGDLPAASDTPEVRRTVDILREDPDGELAARLDASRTFRRLDIEPGDYQTIVGTARERHRPGTLTIIALNTIQAAREVYRQLRGGPYGCTLLHSWFRGIERAALITDVVRRPEGRVVVTTQVIEAGLDLDARLLITEAAPWPSLVRRVSRCGRTGQANAGGEIFWVLPPDPVPYAQEDIDATSAELDRIEGQRLTSADLLARDVRYTSGQVAAIHQAEFAALFDTSLDLGGTDVDIAQYVRDGADLDAEVAWATWSSGEDGAPDPEVRGPAPEYRCRIPIGEVVALAGNLAVWRFDPQAGRWTRVTGQPGSRPRPGELLLMDANAGYTTEMGFDASARGPAPDSPVLLTPAEQAGQAGQAAQAEQAAAMAAAADDAITAAESQPSRRWQSLDEHSQQVRDQAAALIKALAPGISPEAARSVVVASWLHDVGKAHPTWQDALCALADAEDAEEITAGRPWAKSGGKGGALEFAGGVAFKHELVSLLLIDGPLRDLLAEAPDQDLARYLVTAHHGRLRVQVREPADRTVPCLASSPRGTIFGLEQHATSEIPAMLGHPATTLTVDLGQFQPAGEWTRIVLGLRDKYGPFILAYLETLVRVADWRASGGRELPG